jgi:hypothetical protein
LTPSEAALAMDAVRQRAQLVPLRLVGGTEVPEATGVGADLRDLRLGRNLSVVQVAEALLLKPEQVAAIEAMDFQALPGLGYALGYVRGYAELVQAPDVEGLVDGFRAAWEPIQNRKEQTRKTLSREYAVPALVVVCGAAALWLVVWASMHAFAGGPSDETINPPDAAIQEWAATRPALPGGGVATVEPRTLLKALRPVRVELRGADGALVIDRTLRAGEEISTDGLGRWFLSTPDGGALEAHGYGLVVPVGENGLKADWWRVPDLAAMAQAKAEEARLAAAGAESVSADAGLADGALAARQDVVPPAGAPDAAPATTQAQDVTGPPVAGVALPPPVGPAGR